MTAFFDRKVTPAMARESAQRLIDVAFRKEGARAHFSIPTRDSDDDLLLLDYIEQREADLTDALRLLRAFATIHTNGYDDLIEQARREPLTDIDIQFLHEEQEERLLVEVQAFLAQHPEVPR